MQTIFAMHQNGSDDLLKEEKFLKYSIDSIKDLYLTILAALIELKKTEAVFLHKSSLKHLATKDEKNPNNKFINNGILLFLEENNPLGIALEGRKINDWSMNNDAILMLLEDVKKSEIYQNYMYNRVNNFEEDRNFILNLFENIIVPNEKFYSYLEEKTLTWVDDIPLVNTFILKQLATIRGIEDPKFKIPTIYKNEDDKEFAQHLFRKTVLNEATFAKEYHDKTPNWDIERIAEMDTIILKMAICEFLKFPSIPTNVTINEYLELAKEYSTPKSSVFINGILDNILKDMKNTDRLQKIGRGLM
ncbi:transcription antitermination factor NusB [Flavobacterium branchiophilum NBRC 15030 = ATCC 35035]|uniref:N utilization substance protein B homolog (NusB protein) n=3 Tax=Flavobacterium branchiophilum TaxID=55197 RepID=G2Z1V2_FLABF|nr:transcription antitermination factor NusB [Flavobacterium branchiophilum]OXA70215.1 transcription antitermination factor NusB [Flavobacterium branchiophilum NBRC 15030 = ATCC 35035]PDS22749.1 transcription antitermination factor NusB [Flavobacterium branchiophilum]GEM55805.1 N utilization substance protein B [Flavobacterium branchiophilum NBRC 15030 = ATCC 35035]CCB69890.1 N utilization substance protein B homolog (NusB protein) [Flavobacterium branchiophilum FL-15]